MTRRLLLLPAAMLLWLTSAAQFRYSFKDTSTPYVPLSGANSLNGSLIWESENLAAPMPFSWKIDSSFSLNKFNLLLSIPGVAVDTSMADFNGFFFGDIDIADRGWPSGPASRSPIRYLTVGTAPNRIFKLELMNAGFKTEYDQYGTMNDSINFQVWIYETKNIVEFHYGPSRITYPTKYFGFFGNPGPFTGYGKHIDFTTANSGTFYYLKGNAAAPALDSQALPASGFPGYLNAWPASGRVYRFTPKQGCSSPAASFTSGAPSGQTVQYTYTGSTTALDSLVWNFGDGQKQKVTTGFATPVSHTFAANGTYIVTVSAYNNCGSHTVSRQSSLAVGSHAVSGRMKVYPNPVEDQLMIEGMRPGDQLAILSLTGRQLLRGVIRSDKHALSLHNLPAGTYMLSLTEENGACRIIHIIRR